MSFCVHALRISIIITLLRAIGRRIAGACARQGTREQSYAGADRCAVAAIDRGTRCCAHHGSDCGTLYAAVSRGLRRGHSASLVSGILPAIVFICTELIEALASARQHHHAGSGWNGNACA